MLAAEVDVNPWNKLAVLLPRCDAASRSTVSAFCLAFLFSFDDAEDDDEVDDDEVDVDSESFV